VSKDQSAPMTPSTISETVNIELDIIRSLMRTNAAVRLISTHLNLSEEQMKEINDLMGRSNQSIDIALTRLEEMVRELSKKQ